MKLKHFLSSQSGESLVSVMVAIGIAGVLSVVIMNNMELQNKASKTAEIQNNINDFKRLLSDFVSRTEPCNASFRGVARGEDILALKQKVSYTGAAFAEVNKEFQKSGIKILKMKIITLKEQRSMASGDRGDLDNDGVGTAYLRVDIEKMRNDNQPKFFGAKEKFVMVPIIAEFAGEDIVADGIDKADASASWNNKFNALEAAEDAKLVADGFSASDYEVKPEDMVKPAPTDPPFDQSNFIQPPLGNTSVIWGVYHPNFAISDCGNHLSK